MAEGVTAALCAHCGLTPAAGASQDRDGKWFCCPGCAGAYALVRGLGLGGYYARRVLDPAAKPLRPDEAATATDYSAQVHSEADGSAGLYMMVDGLQCGACVWLIEAVLARQPGVIEGRLNMTTRRLRLRWRTDVTDVNTLVGTVARLGYRLAPFDPRRLAHGDTVVEQELLRALAVAGFAAANVMLLSVAIWAGYSQGMGPATRSLMYWFSALIGLPAIVYALQPFLRSALRALMAGRTNMDVPISIGVILTTIMSLAETIRGGEHAYFDSAISLLFFLLIGRYLDQRARGRARSAAEHLLSLGAAAVTVIREGGQLAILPPGEVRVGMMVLVTAGERVPVDGRIASGLSDLDTSLITGESTPVTVGPGEKIFAGTLNLSAPLHLEVEAVGEGTLLAEIVRLMEVAGQGRARHVAIADRVSRLYAPVVHLAALLTFLGWVFVGGMAWQPALLIAVSVLIITCPCALALAVPAVQVIASGHLLRRGILLKSATALERLARVDTVAFDKTGTLTLGLPELAPADAGPEALHLAAGLAAASRHPLARALVRAVPGVAVLAGVREIAGAGLILDTPEGEIRLGHRRFAGAEGAEGAAPGPELWLARPGLPPVRFSFLDRPRADAGAVVGMLGAAGYRIVLLSGDRAPVAAAVAGRLGITEWHADLTPAAKTAHLAALAAAGRTVLMVGDGLNDAPALTAAAVSMSPSSAVDVSQTAADAVFQGQRLAPVIEALAVARRAEALVHQNFALALLYNLVTVPLAVCGLVTPLIAAVSMSTSSVLVIINALRLSRTGGEGGQRNVGTGLPDVRGPGTRAVRPDRLPLGAAERAV
ncbi:MAG: heavy metal translocating P-type ATPase metal-binding domain-containing protein [Rhodospirillaceae bacterium]